MSWILANRAVISRRWARVALACSIALVLVGCSSETRVTEPAVRLPAGLKIHDVTVGNGTLATSGRIAVIHYIIWLTDSTLVDSSFDRGQPFSFTMGSGQVIQGLDLGILGMRVGGRRILTISPDLAYGPNGYPPVIPPDATVLMDLMLLEVRDP